MGGSEEGLKLFRSLIQLFGKTLWESTDLTTPLSKVRTSVTLTCSRHIPSEPNHSAEYLVKMFTLAERNNSAVNHLSFLFIVQMIYQA